MSHDVLVVDDEDAVRQVLVRWLNRWGYTVREAISASDAIEQMTARPASILLTDLMMPVHDGIWLTDQVRKRWPYTVVVIASGMDDLNTAAALRQQGAVDYVTKPLGRERVRQAMDRARTKANSVQDPPGSISMPGPSPMDVIPVTPASPRRTIKLLNSRDIPLGVGLILGTLLIFHEPLRFLFDIASDIEGRYHLDLIPALTVFGVVFGFHQYRKQQDARHAGAVALGDARRANERSEELERLVAFGRDLANSVTLDMIRPVLWEYLPAFGADRNFWVLVHAAGRWEVLIGDASVSALDEMEQLAERATVSEVLRDGQVEGVPVDDRMCYPMVVANVPIGVIGIPASVLTSHTVRRRIGAAATLVAIAIKNAQLYQLSQDRGTRDSLTGCFNRGYAIEALESELRRAKRTGLPLTALMFDLDHFKTINDRYGHLTGDRVLMEVTQQLQDTIRASDIKCRYGGDEFVVILPETDLAGGKRVAENLRDAVARLAILSGNDEQLSVTISTGVATATPGELGADALLTRADLALYRAKQSGRNRTGTETPATTAAL